MAQRLTDKQVAWLKQATPEQVEAFIVQGDPDSVTLYNFTTHEETHAPTLRGLRLSGSYKTEQEAYAEAVSFKKKLQAKDLPALDTSDGSVHHQNARVMGEADQAGLGTCLEVVFHLGTMWPCDVGSFDSFKDKFLDDLDMAVKDLGKSMGLKKSLLAYAKEVGDYEAFREFCFDNGLHGFLAQARTPVRHEQGHFSWGRTTSKWFYAETFEDLWAQARKWGEKIYKDTEKKQKATA
jgi:hypothetical protein